jgi:hypothetical protein
MNAFYREFFQIGVEGDGRAIRGSSCIFRSEVSEGQSPPSGWRQFTGDRRDHIDQSFNDTIGTLFHEADTSSSRSRRGRRAGSTRSRVLLPGTRILANGTVLMNMPASDG